MPAATIAIETILLTWAFLAPDFLLNRKPVFGRSRKAFGYMILIALISFSIAATGSRAVEAVVVAGLFLIVMTWHVCYAYFGDILRPESILLLVKPDHLRDAADVAARDYSRFGHVIAAVGLPFLAALTVVLAAPSHSAVMMPGAAMLAPLILLAIGLSAAFKSGGRGAYPKLHMPAVIGGIHALALALRWLLRGARTLPGEVSYRFEAPDPGPRTIAVIMGESIAFERMGLYRPGLDTTPNLERIAATSSPLHLFARTGFAAAVSSNASVAGFLSGSPYAWRTRGARTLFDLARQQGFATSYLSAQVRTPLDVLGGVSFIDRIHTQESDYTLFEQRRDWMLKDLVAEVPVDRDHFMFLYNRVNHAPYHDHDIAGSDEIIHPNPRTGEEVIANYDVGMRVYDRMLAELVSQIDTREGDIFIFASSDHNEMLGQSGIWGHVSSWMVEGAAVPMMLFTNRPDHPVARAFRDADRLDAFSVARLAMSLMGVTPVSDNPEGRFYIGNPLPFAMSGYMSLERAGNCGFDVQHHDYNGRLLNSGSFSGEDFLSPITGLSRARDGFP